MKKVKKLLTMAMATVIKITKKISLLLAKLIYPILSAAIIPRVVDPIANVNEKGRNAFQESLINFDRYSISTLITSYI